jgi:serine/threonine protein kinase
MSPVTTRLSTVLSAERFTREITTTVALQHPRILPLFNPGTADGFLFSVMPFIDGVTLRTTLDREAGSTSLASTVSRIMPSLGRDSMGQRHP